MKAIVSMIHNHTTTIDDHIVFSCPFYLQVTPPKCVWGTEQALAPEETLEHSGRSVAGHRVDHGITPFVIRVRGGEIRIRSRLELLPVLQPITQNGRSQLWS
jgi:hypothetical protein